MMHFQHHVEIAHAMPGRVRLRLPHRRGHAGFFAEAERRIATLDGVSSVSANRYAGSITVYYGKDFRVESVTDELAGAASVCVAASAAMIRPRDRETARTREAMIMLLQLAIAVLLGRAVTHVLESFAKHLIERTFHYFAPEFRAA